MNVVSIIMAAFSLLAALDLITGNHLKIGKEFERGLHMLGPMAISMVGMLVLVPGIEALLTPALHALTSVVPFLEPSSLVGCLLANDMGGAPLSQALAKTELSGYFNGLVVGSMMGATVSFTIPLTMSMVRKEQQDKMLMGLLCGICTVPVGCIVAGLMLLMPPLELLINVIPLLLFSLLLVLALLFIPRAAVKIFAVLGGAVRIVIIGGLAVGLFSSLTGVTVPYTAPIADGFSVIFKCAAVMTGAFPLISLLSRLLRRPLTVLGGRIGINPVSAVNLVGTLATNLTTFSMMGEMDDKGVVLNSAFAVSAAFTFAGHLAFTLSTNPDCLPAVIVGKLVAGFCSLPVAAFFYARQQKSASVAAA